MLSSTAFWLCLYGFFLVSTGDKIVYLDRLDASNGTMWEPYFNPQNMTADIGEQVHFVARLENIGARYGTVLIASSCAYMPSSHSRQSPGHLQNLTIRVLAYTMKVRQTSFHI
jgi:hypothetical protein